MSVCVCVCLCACFCWSMYSTVSVSLCSCEVVFEIVLYDTCLRPNVFDSQKCVCCQRVNILSVGFCNKEDTRRTLGCTKYKAFQELVQTFWKLV